MSNAEKNKQFLLYMDILGTEKKTDGDSEELSVIEELIDIFVKNNRQHHVEDIPTSPRKCYLIRSSIKPTNSNLENFSIPAWTAAYVRFENQLFYILKGANNCDEISIKLNEITKFDNELQLEKCETDNPTILSDTNLALIREITNHTHSIGIISFQKISPTISSYSDHISISMPFADNEFDSACNIGNLVSHASWLHHIALNKGMLMRGAITMGTLVHHGNKIFGNALNKAVSIEENVAVYPRVVIENEVVKLLPLNLRMFIEIDNDGLYYINYLKDKRYVDNKFKTLISTLLKDNLQSCKTPREMGIYAKWHWLANKFGYMFSHVLAQPTISIS